MLLVSKQAFTGGINPTVPLFHEAGFAMGKGAVLIEQHPFKIAQRLASQQQLSHSH